MNVNDNISVSDVFAKMICICGSSRFADVAAVAAWTFEKKGFIAFSIHLLPEWYWVGTKKEGEGHAAEQEGVAHVLDELHLKKIYLADSVFVLNLPTREHPEGYIGERTAIEIAYAKKLGRPIEYIFGEGSTPLGDEVRAALSLRGL